MPLVPLTLARRQKLPRNVLGCVGKAFGYFAGGYQK
jgi:hypothetical protein